MKRVCVFCGASPGADAGYREAARRMGAEIAGHGLELVYGGGKVGLMGAVADAALAAGGRVTGVIPEALMAKELAHTGLSSLEVVASMHQRKARMAELADAFVALPGGFGTLEEFCEVLTWAQLGIHAKPMGLLNALGFYAPLLAMFDHAAAQGFVRPDHRAMVLVDDDPADLLAALAAHTRVPAQKWLTPDET